MQYIDKGCRRFLKVVKKISISQNTDRVRVADIAQAMKCSEFEVDVIIEFLIDLHIIKVDSCGGEYTAVHLTRLGLCYNAYRWSDFKKTVLFSIILPLIISAVSGSLTSLLVQILSLQ